MEDSPLTEDKLDRVLEELNRLRNEVREVKNKVNRGNRRIRDIQYDNERERDNFVPLLY